jgi:aminopeptidase
MARAAQPLTELMRRTDRVHITGPGTDLRFSIKGIGVVQCTGECNIPDGEVFTAPVRDSIEGTVKFNCRSTDRATGVAFDDISLTFEAGKVVDLNTADPRRNDALWNILRQDDGASYIGEFAIGFHPHITHPMNDILFDEKIAGSFHMALGNAYKTADNGNRSGLHWDLVQIQRPDFGGGTISFDDVVIRRDGRFILPELEALNPENLGTQNCSPEAGMTAYPIS